MRLKHIVLCLLPLSIAACVLKPKSERAIQSETSIVTKNYKWDKKELTVCFMDSKEQFESYEKQNLFVEKSNATAFNLLPLFDKQKKDIQTAVEISFNKENLGLKFIGWKTCTDAEIPDVAVGFSYSPFQVDLSVSAIGDPSKRYKTKKINIVRLNLGYYTYLDENALEISQRHNADRALQSQMIEDYKSYDIISSIVHEFGHIAGLHHEHYRTDSYEMMKAADINFNSNSAKNLIVSNEQLKLSASEESKDFQFVGEYDPFSAMNYMRGSNYIMLEIALDCLEKKHDSLSPEEFKIVCDYNQIKKFTRRDSNENYLSVGDIEALKVLYLGSAVPKKLNADAQKKYAWIKQAKIIIEKHQLKFPQVLNEQPVDIPLEALFCPFNQDSQVKVIRILADKNANITRAWYSQNKYKLPYFYYYGFEFTSIQKSNACENCVDLGANYKNQSFKTNVKFKAPGERFVLRINDLSTNLECYKDDILLLNEVLKAQKMRDGREIPTNF